ncbi:hypothetical protein Hanom_Chr03g00191241 [Helianthus anomalus]
MCHLMPPTQPNPSLTIPHGRGFGFVFHVSTHAPNPSPTIPHGLIERFSR